MTSFVRIAAALAWLIALAWCLDSAYAQNNWPSWRGPTADGHSSETGLPQRWSQASIQWTSPLPGNGQSSPIIWGDRIFLTASVANGRTRLVVCLHRDDGKELWRKVAWEGEPEPSHAMNGWASASCATDGERVVAFFGIGGLHCYSVQGDLLWSRELGSFEGPWGTAASPIIVRNMVIQNCDADGEAYLIAVDKFSGDTIWKTNRPVNRGWSTPVLVRTDETEEIVLNGHTGVTAYDPNSGKQLWHCACTQGRGSPTVTPSAGMLYVLNGLSDGGAYCVVPGGTGDVTATHRKWISRRGGRDLSSPIVLGETMLAMGLRSSILTAYDIRDGRQLWEKRIGGQISASPIAYEGRAYFIDETGKTLVVDPKTDEKIVAANVFASSDDELFRASITPLNGQLFIRSNRYLYCIGDSD